MRPIDQDGRVITTPNDGRPRLIVITGIMASGKSTVAQVLAGRLDRAVHVPGDVFRRMIVSGQTPITPDAGRAMAEQLRLRYRLSAMVADEYVRAGFTAVVQDVVLGPDLAFYVEQVATRPLAVVVLAPRPEVVARREIDRPKTGYRDWTVESLDDALRQETPRLGLWLDSSDQTPEQTVEEILARLPEAVVSRR